MRFVVKFWQLLNFFCCRVVVNVFSNALIEVWLEKMHLPFIGCYDGSQILDGFEELGILREMINSISIENYNFILGYALDEVWEKFIHVWISPKTRSNYPSMNSFFP